MRSTLLLLATLVAMPALAEEPPRLPGAQPDPGQVSAPGATSGKTTLYQAAPSKEAEVAWPCAQRKVASISAGTIWSGPDLAQGAGWDDDNKIAGLAQRLASRRMDLTEADQAIADFAREAGGDKDRQLTKLFVGVLDIINENRGKVLQGITRYAAGQERLAERLRDESDKISAARDEPSIAFNADATGKEKEFEWDQRIFNDRRQALSYVCETPSLLERRASDIARRIQAQL